MPHSQSLRAAHLGLLLGGFGLVILSAILRMNSEDDVLTTIEAWVGIVAVAAGVVCGLVLLHRCWRCVARHAPAFGFRPRLDDPGMAVALCAIPIVNVVGVFFSLGPLPRELNRIAHAVGIRPSAPGDLGYGTAVMMVLGLIPYVGWLLAFVAGTTLLPILLFRCSKLAEAIEGAVAAPAS